MTDAYYLPFGPEAKLEKPFGIKPADEWRAPVGEPIRAAGDGVVVFAGEAEDRFYADNFAARLNHTGDVVVLKTEGAIGPFFEYRNVGKLEVKSNERVEAGQIVGLAGEESVAVSALPWRFNLASRTSGRVNPRLYQTEYWTNEALAKAEEEPVVVISQKTEEPAAPKRRRNSRAAEPVVSSEPVDSPPVVITPVEDAAPPAEPVDAFPVSDAAPDSAPIDSGVSTES